MELVSICWRFATEVEHCRQKESMRHWTLYCDAVSDLSGNKVNFKVIIHPIAPSCLYM
jgi:hypothetical protein